MPRGTLIHHYRVDRDGLVVWVNLIVATSHNGLAMNRGLLQVARRFVDGPDIPEGACNRLQAVVRVFDPCLSCSTHALGPSGFAIEVVNARGEPIRPLSLLRLPSRLTPALGPVSLPVGETC